MGRNRQETLRIEHRRLQVVQLHIKGWHQSEIACELGVSRAIHTNSEISGKAQVFRVNQIDLSRSA